MKLREHDMESVARARRGKLTLFFQKGCYCVLSDATVENASSKVVKKSQFTIGFNAFRRLVFAMLQLLPKHNFAIAATTLPGTSFL